MCDSRELGMASLGLRRSGSPECLTHQGEVDHTRLLSSQFKNLLLSQDYTDVTFLVDDKVIHAHRIILSARCEYFRALLFGGMKETSTSEEIPLIDTPAEAFEAVLKYIYSGCVMLKDIKEEDVVDILGLAHKYGLLSLESAVAGYLKANVTVQNVTVIFDVACLYQLEDLKMTCLTFMDHNALDILENDGFYNLSKSSLEIILKRDSFYAPEIHIFRALRRWIAENTKEDIDSLLKTVRLSLINLDNLLGDVRGSDLFSADVILDAIQEQSQSKANDRKFRGYQDEDENLAQTCYGAEVISGEMKECLLDQRDCSYDLEKGFSRHLIGDGEDGITIAFGKPSIINQIKLLLWDKDSRAYSYKVEYSMDNLDWSCCWDYSQFYCRAWQVLRFPPRVMRYCRFIGTRNTHNRCFHLVTAECSYSTRSCQVHNGFIAPSNNVASVQASALVLEGVSRNRFALIDGDTQNYDWESGYTCHQIGSGRIVIQLAQPFYIGSMRMLLWDCDDRSYSYFIEVSLDRKEWTMVCDRREENCRSWQTIVFNPLPFSFIKIIGTNNTANEVFHVVHIESPAVDRDSSSDSHTTESATDREDPED